MKSQMITAYELLRTANSAYARARDSFIKVAINERRRLGAQPKVVFEGRPQKVCYQSNAKFRQASSVHKKRLRACNSVKEATTTT